MLDLLAVSEWFCFLAYPEEGLPAWWFPLCAWCGMHSYDTRAFYMRAAKLQVVAP